MSPIGPFLDPIPILEEVKHKKTPFSLFKMKGNGYWNEGYWKKMLQDNGLSFYSIEPIFVINIKRIRELNAGDKLRLHYQRLSTDVNSLLNIDQDLINNLQIEVPLGTLKGKAKITLQNDDQYIVNWLRELNKVRKVVNAENSGIFQQGTSDMAEEDDLLFEHDEL